MLGEADCEIEDSKKSLLTFVERAAQDGLVFSSVCQSVFLPQDILRYGTMDAKAGNH